MTELSSEALEARRAYNRKYYHEHKERILERQKRYRENNPEKMREYARKFWENRANERKEQDPEE